MSDIGDTFSGMEEASKLRRASNRQTTPALLVQHGVAFVEHNSGAHLVITHNGKTADLWPGTGKYQVRGSGRYSRGVFNLLRALGVKVGR